MQVFHWLLKLSDQSNNSTNRDSASDKEDGSKYIIALHRRRGTHRGVRTRERSCRLDRRKNTDLFRSLWTDDVLKAYFYNTVNLKKLRSLNGIQSEELILSMKIEEESLTRRLGPSEHPNGAYAGQDVLPLREPMPASGGNTAKHNERLNGRIPVRMSRMKELQRWVAEAKSNEGGKFKSNEAMRFGSSASNSLSIRDGPASISSSRCITRSGNWITTDSEFVVLELWS